MVNNSESNRVTKRILVCEDDSYIADALSYGLRERGYEVHAVQDGYAALELLRQIKFDGVITDILLPKLNGVEILLASRERSPKAALFIITALDSSYLDARAREFNVRAVFKKPFELEQVLEQIEMHTGQTDQEHSSTRILLVDDYAPVGEYIAEVLIAKGYTVELERDGRAAFDKIKSRPNYYNIAFVDICLTGMPGGELIKEIRKLSPATLCVAITGEGSHDDVRRCYENGAHNVMYKPMNPEVLGYAAASYEREAMTLLGEHRRRQEDRKRPLTTRAVKFVQKCIDVEPGTKKSRLLKTVAFWAALVLVNISVFFVIVETQKGIDSAVQKMEQETEEYARYLKELKMQERQYFRLPGGKQRDAEYDYQTEKGKLEPVFAR